MKNHLLNIMEKKHCSMIPYAFKRVFYFKSDFKELVNNVFKEASHKVLTSEKSGDIKYTIYSNYVVIHCNSEDLIKKMEFIVIIKLPKDVLIFSHLTNHPVKFDEIQKFQIYTNLPLGQYISQTYMIIKESFEKYTLKTMFLSFNGGKDCVVLLHLLLTLVNELKISDPIKTVYFQSNDQFLEEEEYVHYIAKKYNLDLEIINGDLKHGLESFLERNTAFCASLIGTRQSDTGSTKLKYFQKTDPEWPQLMRIHPIMNWNYDTVWSFLRQFSIPYCCLYDKGYTSLGNKSKSKPNPHLKYIDEKTGEVQYLPAFLLQNSDTERHSRI
ncbi:FAD synthase-like isoform X2 [Daktulosphaira vitifoliae]|uniref:FAD synthase-like isoform X2 n=1 Tax=Daktulosphaira vitifoliae TaxID=58002 RepID=UPI0021A9F411|nr:FAD synthase-like isoform X2 [Daktulosphaira vitifoliae]XP_050544767.1 FAD synthase-like isoform X2 [Daktulosphaira vitifoliae]